MVEVIKSGSRFAVIAFLVTLSSAELSSADTGTTQITSPFVAAQTFSTGERTIQTSIQWQRANDAYRKRLREERRARLVATLIGAFVLKGVFEAAFSPDPARSYTDEGISIGLGITDNGVSLIRLSRKF